MATPDLNVFLYGEPVGRLSGKRTLITGFKYRSGYAGPKLSHSMPITKRNVGREIASSWFGGLLPEGSELRRAMAEAHGSRDTTSMGLLEQAGLDCAGAVQITADDDLPEREQGFEPISDAEISKRLIAAISGQPVTEQSERWSVAGQQGKLALHRTRDDQWCRALGGLPTTHIIKPGITFVGREAIEDQALTEHLTLAAARMIGVSAVESAFHEFDGVPAVVIQRYDRVRLDREVWRIHQEDLCQALGIGAERKYEEDGGPGVAQIAAFLDQIADTPRQSVAFRTAFATMVMFSHFSGSPDAHAKNYSILILPDGSVTLASLYDAASGFGYSFADTGEPRFAKSAMKIGHEYRFNGVADRDWERFSRDLGLPAELVRSERDRIARELPDAMRSVLGGNDIPADARDRVLKGPLLIRVERVCSLAA